MVPDTTYLIQTYLVGTLEGAEVELPATVEVFYDPDDPKIEDEDRYLVEGIYHGHHSEVRCQGEPIHPMVPDDVHGALMDQGAWVDWLRREVMRERVMRERRAA